MKLHDEQCELTLFAGCDYVHHNFRHGVTIDNTAEHWTRPPSPTELSMYQVQHKPICTCKAKHSLLGSALEKQP